MALPALKFCVSKRKRKQRWHLQTYSWNRGARHCTTTWPRSLACGEGAQHRERASEVNTEIGLKNNQTTKQSFYNKSHVCGKDTDTQRFISSSVALCLM